MLMNQQKLEAPLPYREAGITTKWIPPTVIRWQKQIESSALKYDIDVNVIAILMTMESGGGPKAKSGAGAEGLMQIMPATAQEIAKKHLKQPVENYDIYDPATNIEFGTAYLAWLRDEFGIIQHAPDYNTTVELIAAGYNGGAGAAKAIDDGEGLRNLETMSYSRDAFYMWRERTSETSPTFDRWKERGGNALLEAAAKN